MNNKILPDSWMSKLKYVCSDEFSQLGNRIAEERKTKTIYPSQKDVFRLFHLISPEDIKVVILGQDPYHNGMADGLAFSTESNNCPKSLSNILKVMGNKNPKSYSLEYLVKQGVFLFNTALTVIKNTPGSHTKLWEGFTKDVITNIDNENVIFLLLGKHAESFSKLIKKGKIFTTSHPSPYSAHLGFLNSNCFNEVNLLLEELNIKPINWI